MTAAARKVSLPQSTRRTTQEICRDHEAARQSEQTRRAHRSSVTAFRRKNEVTATAGKVSLPQSTRRFHHRLGAAVADDFHALALVNHISLRNDIQDFVAKLGLATGAQRRDRHAHLANA